MSRRLLVALAVAGRGARGRRRRRSCCSPTTSSRTAGRGRPWPGRVRRDLDRHRARCLAATSGKPCRAAHGGARVRRSSGPAVLERVAALRLLHGARRACRSRSSSTSSSRSRAVGSRRASNGGWSPASTGAWLVLASALGALSGQPYGAGRLPAAVRRTRFSSWTPTPLRRRLPSGGGRARRRRASSSPSSCSCGRCERRAGRRVARSTPCS